MRHETGRTVLQWITERRMAEARRQLLETDRRGREVAEEVGYADAGHFIQTFQRFHGTTPQRWRRARRRAA